MSLALSSELLNRAQKAPHKRSLRSRLRRFASAAGQDVRAAAVATASRALALSSATVDVGVGVTRASTRRATAPRDAPSRVRRSRSTRREPASGKLTPTGCVYEVDEPLGILAADHQRWGA